MPLAFSSSSPVRLSSPLAHPWTIQVHGMSAGQGSADFWYVNKVINGTNQGSTVQNSACSGWCTGLPRSLPAAFPFPGLVAFEILAVKSWDFGGFCPTVFSGCSGCQQAPIRWETP